MDGNGIATCLLVRKRHFAHDRCQIFFFLEKLGCIIKSATASSNSPGRGRALRRGETAVSKDVFIHLAGRPTWIQLMLRQDVEFSQQSSLFFPARNRGSEALRDSPKATRGAREAVGIQGQIRYKAGLHAGIFCHLIFSAAEGARKPIDPQDLRSRHGKRRPVGLGPDLG